MISKYNNHEDKSIICSIRFLESEKKELEQFAKETKVTMSDVVRRAVKLYIAAQRKKIEAEKKLEGKKKSWRF